MRCGICAGSVCLTALKTGVRRPLVTMLMECADAAHNLNGYVMLDGGVRCPADWCKALVAGADLCMTGSVFAGTDEAEVTSLRSNSGLVSLMHLISQSSSPKSSKHTMACQVTMHRRSSLGEFATIGQVKEERS